MVYQIKAGLKIALFLLLLHALKEQNFNMI